MFSWVNEIFFRFVMNIQLDLPLAILSCQFLAQIVSSQSAFLKSSIPARSETLAYDFRSSAKIFDLTASGRLSVILFIKIIKRTGPAKFFNTK